MITTVMFDLDGTLVHFEYEDFIKAYLEAVAAKVAHLTEPRGFVQQLLLSTDEMIRSLILQGATVKSSGTIFQKG